MSLKYCEKPKKVKENDKSTEYVHQPRESKFVSDLYNLPILQPLDYWVKSILDWNFKQLMTLNWSPWNWEKVMIMTIVTSEK